MFERHESHGRLLGISLRFERAFFFFGSRFVPREDLLRLFPAYEFCFLRQVHGHLVRPAGGEEEADAHFTSTPARAVVVQTADCVPILLAAGDQVCAVHAGWRGVAQNIVAQVHATLPDFHPQVAAIGPHILRPSFEVGQDVADLLLQGAPSGELGPFAISDPALMNGKVWFDLLALVRAQLRAAFGESLRIFACGENTMQPSFHSFRRDHEAAGRQYSFVVLNH